VTALWSEDGNAATRGVRSVQPLGGLEIAAGRSKLERSLPAHIPACARGAEARPREAIAPGAQGARGVLFGALLFCGRPRDPPHVVAGVWQMGLAGGLGVAGHFRGAGRNGRSRSHQIQSYVSGSCSDARVGRGGSHELDQRWIGFAPERDASGPPESSSKALRSPSRPTTFSVSGCAVRADRPSNSLG